MPSSPGAFSKICERALPLTESTSPNRDAYDRDYYARMYRTNAFTCPARKWREREENLLDLVRPHPEMTLLELGCARGDTAFFFAPRVRRVIGLDGEPLAIELARRRAGEAGISNVEFHLADARSFPEVADRSIDCAGAFDFLEHILDEVASRMLREVARVLKPSGRFVAYTPNREHWVERLKAHNFLLRQQPDHIAVRRPRAIEILLRESGLRLVRVFYPAAPYPLYRPIDQLLKGLPFLGRPFRFRICLEAKLA